MHHLAFSERPMPGSGQKRGHMTDGAPRPISPHFVADLRRTLNHLYDPDELRRNPLFVALGTLAWLGSPSLLRERHRADRRAEARAWPRSRLGRLAVPIGRAPPLRRTVHPGRGRGNPGREHPPGASAGKPGAAGVGRSALERAIPSKRTTRISRSRPPTMSWRTKIQRPSKSSRRATRRRLEDDAPLAGELAWLGQSLPSTGSTWLSW